MVIIEYHPINGKAIPDGMVVETFRQIKWMIEICQYEHLIYSTENIFNRIRLSVVEGEIDPEKFRFYYDGQEIVVNRYGATQKWPKGFCGFNTFLSEQILRARIKKRREE